MSKNRVGGLITLSIDGELLKAKGAFTCRPSMNQRNDVAGSSANDPVHGFTEEAMVPFIEGVITIANDDDVDRIIKMVDTLGKVDLANGKTFVLREGWYSGSGEYNSETGELPFRMSGKSGEFI